VAASFVENLGSDLIGASSVTVSGNAATFNVVSRGRSGNTRRHAFEQRVLFGAVKRRLLRNRDRDRRTADYFRGRRSAAYGNVH
jgi:hypothetical protein